jgi:ABC-type nickel/cobalt efflux system permease component RcnA
MATRGRGSSKKFGITKYLQLLSFCQTIISTLPVGYYNFKTVWDNLNEVDKNMTTLTAMLIAQKERNKNRHKPEEAHRHQQPHRHTKNRHHLVDKKKIFLGLFAQNQATWKVTAGLLKRRKGKWAPRPLCIN